MGRLRVFVVRHGETEWVRERRFAGSRDIPLTEAGRDQCAAVARALAGTAIAAVYASPLERARASAEVIAKPHGLPVRLAPAFSEMCFGSWEGLTRDEVQARHPNAWAQWRTAPHLLTRLVAESALARAESRGAHFRADFPAEDPVFAGHVVLRPGAEPALERWS